MTEIQEGSKVARAEVDELLARLAAVEAERDEYKRRDQLKANRPLAESLLFRDKSEMSDAEQAVATYVGQCVAGRYDAEEALRVIPPERLELLADWFDADDRAKGRQPGGDVQDDLRRMASLSRAALSSEDATRPTGDKQ